jgi:hypothetical protein
MTIQHYDQLGQLLQLGQLVAFSSSYTPGAKLGKVIAITPKRIRVEYVHTYYKDTGELIMYNCQHVTRPDEVIILNDATQQYITLSTLKTVSSV